jgi:hypothetical protein
VQQHCHQVAVVSVHVLPPQLARLDLQAASADTRRTR